MTKFKVDNNEYDIPPVVMDILNATADERDELLEALKECANRLEIHMKHTEDLVAHMRACRAIAKAEGR